MPARTIPEQEARSVHVITLVAAQWASVGRIDRGRHDFRHAATHVLVTAVLALLSALAFAVATVAQQQAAAQSADSDARGRRFVGQLLRNPRWWASNLGTGVAYVLQATALAFGSLLVVQPLLVSSLLFALPLSARRAGRRPARAMWWWAAVLAAALAVFVVLGNANNGRSHATGKGWLIVALVGLPVIAGCVVAAHHRSGAVRASLLAIPVGILGGALAVLTKAVVTTLAHHPGHLVGSGDLYGLLAVGGAGIYVQQLAFQAGALQASLPIITVLEPIVAAALGLGLLHEQLRASGLRLAVLVLAALVMVLATVVLSRGRAHAVGDDPPIGVDEDPTGR